MLITTKYLQFLTPDQRFDQIMTKYRPHASTMILPQMKPKDGAIRWTMTWPMAARRSR